MALIGAYFNVVPYPRFGTGTTSHPNVEHWKRQPADFHVVGVHHDLVARIIHLLAVQFEVILVQPVQGNRTPPIDAEAEAPDRIVEAHVLQRGIGVFRAAEACHLVAGLVHGGADVPSHGTQIDLGPTLGLAILKIFDKEMLLAGAAGRGGQQASGIALEDNRDIVRAAEQRRRGVLRDITLCGDVRRELRPGQVAQRELGLRIEGLRILRARRFDFGPRNCIALRVL